MPASAPACSLILGHGPQQGQAGQASAGHGHSSRHVLITQAAPEQGCRVHPCRTAVPCGASARRLSTISTCMHLCRHHQLCHVTHMTHMHALHMPCRSHAYAMSPAAQHPAAAPAAAGRQRTHAHMQRSDALHLRKDCTAASLEIRAMPKPSLAQTMPHLGQANVIPYPTSRARAMYTHCAEGPRSGSTGSAAHRARQPLYNALQRATATGHDTAAQL